MAANNSISLVNLDFDTFKEQLKTYLRGQAQFSDYDFDGSNMSVLLDILSYNTHLNAFYLNMVASEMFLDSAQLRNSVISIAKSLNYTPRSTKSAKAILNLQFAQSGLSSFTIPKYTRFSGKNSRGTFQFSTNEAVVLYPSGGSFTIQNLNIFEGVVTNQTFVMNYAIERQRFILSNNLIDTDSLEVSVTEDVNSTPVIYRRTNSLLDVQSTSNVYFVQATEDTRYEIVFGDGVFGNIPKDGSIVTVTYRITSATDGNDCANFNLNDNLGAINGFGSSILPTITVVTPSFGGADAETIEEIRYRAPKAFQTQDRAITVSDFTTIVTQEYQNIKNVHVYGGEEIIDAPRYGSVYIVPITFTGELISEEEKLDIETFLKRKTTIGVTPIVINPDFLFVDVTTTVRYNPSETILTANDIASLVKDTIQNFNTEQLTDFNVELNFSKLSTAINDADDSIVGNQTELTLKKVFVPDIGINSFPAIDFRNSIVPGTILSSTFLSMGRLYQYTDLNPNLNTFEVSFDGERTSIRNTTTNLYIADITRPETVTYSVAGIIDYSAGRITIDPIVVNDLINSSGIEVKARPLNTDITSRLNDIININTATGISVTVKKS
jgi:hypothetical protein